MFIQIVEFESTRMDEMRELEEQWVQDTEGRRTSLRSYLCQDLNRPNCYSVIAMFPSREAAERNSNLPETSAFAEQMSKLCDSLSFTDLDVLDEGEGR